MDAQQTAQRIREQRDKDRKAPAPKAAKAVDPEKAFMEKLAKVRAVREGRLRDFFPIKHKDPTKAYQLGSTSPTEITNARLRGWEIVRTEKNDINNPSEVWTPHRNEQGEHVLGDLILMEMDKEEHEIAELIPQVEAWERQHGTAKYEDVMAFAAANNIPATVTEQEA